MASSTTTAATICLNTYQQIQFVIGTAEEVTVNEKVRVPAYLISLNVGDKLMAEHKDKFKKNSYLSSAQLTENHKVEELQSQQLLCVANFPRKQIGSRKSDCLITGVQNPNLSCSEKRTSTVAMKPSQEIPNGSLVGSGGKSVVLEANARNLEWSDFVKADLRIGTVKSAKLVKVSELVQRVVLEIDFGFSNPLSTVVDWSQIPANIKGVQVLGVVNINPDDLRKEFGTKAEALLCSPQDGVWLAPTKKVENGFKLA